MTFYQTVETPKGNLIWSAVNTKDFMPDFVQALAQSALLIQESLEAFWLVQKAEMYLTDAKRVVSTSLTALGLVNAIADSLVEVMTQAVDTSFHNLIVTSESGGFNKFISKVQYHLFDATDPNRPIDEGNAVLMPVMFIKSDPDMLVAKQAMDDISRLWNNSREEGKAFLKEFSSDEEKRNEFWKHYYKKRIIGSRVKVSEDGWTKNSLADMLPQKAINWMQSMLDSWGESNAGAPDTSSLIKTTEAMYESIIGMIKDVVKIIDAYTRLFLDQQLTLLVLPPISGEALNLGSITYKYNEDLFQMLAAPDFDYSGKKSAVELLSEYLITLPDILQTAAKDIETDPAIKTGIGYPASKQVELFGEITVANPFNKENIETNVVNFLRPDYFVGGWVFVFKGPSIDLVYAQARAFFSIFGINIPEFKTDYSI